MQEAGLPICRKHQSCNDPRSVVLAVGRLSATLLVLLCAALWLPSAVAARHTVAGWGMEQGLPHNLVQSVAQGSDGFLWLGTWEGVARFNGKTFTVFDRQNTPGVELSGVMSIVPEADGAMLFGTVSDGVYRYHKGRWQALGGARARHLSVAGMLRDREGALWLIAKGKLLRMQPSGELEDIGAALKLPDAAITSLRQDPQGALLIATEQGIHRLWQGRLHPWQDTQALVVRDLVDDGEAGWIAATDDGVHWWHADGRHEHLRAGERVDAVRRDGSGALWMSLSAGRLERYFHGALERVAIPGQVSPALLVDREGLVWAGSTDGLFRVDEGAASGITVADGLSANYVRAVMQTGDGTVWIGHTEGLDRLQEGRTTRVPLRPGRRRDASVLALAAGDDQLWVGTYNDGVLGLDAQGRVRQQVTLPGASQPIVRALLAEADGTMWIGSGDGLYRYREGALRHYGTADGLPALAVHALYRDPAGVLWIGTSDGMAALDAAGKLQAWHADTGSFPARYVFDFLGDDNGDLWIATDHGLLRRRGPEFQVFDHGNGLPRDKLFRILDDGRGHLWVSSNQGVFRLDRQDLVAVAAGARTQLAVHVVDHTDGMPGSQGNGASSPAGWMTQQGQLLFATSDGVAVIDPARVGNERLHTAPIAVETVSIDGAGQPLLDRYPLPAQVERISVEYAGLGFRAPDKMRYRYRLEGFDADWVEAGTRTEAIYTNLAPGNYRLRMQAMALPLDWSRSERIGETSLLLEIAPPLWRRPWVLALGSLALLGSVLALWGWRTARYRQQERSLQQEIAARTRELSEKNHALEQAGRERDGVLRKLAHQATHDALTGLPNRRAADAHLQKMLQQAKERAAPLTVALVDLDHFKQINDHYGHDAGDQVLCDVAGLLRLRLGEEQFAARHGGEEFLIVLRDTALSDAMPLLRELCARAARLPLAEIGPHANITISIGAAELTGGQDTVRTLLAAADRQLYRAKNEGRNRVLC
ncbi:MAG: diguanylate cyclase [Stenotrophomonas sp.]